MTFSGERARQVRSQNFCWEQKRQVLSQPREVLMVASLDALSH